MPRSDASRDAPAVPAPPSREPEANPDQLWEYDSGTLSADARRALVKLVQGPYVSSQSHPALWRATLNGEEALRSRLADMFLELIVDEDSGIAFVRNVSAPEAEAPAVVRTHQLTLLDSALVLQLRHELLRVDRGMRAIIGEEEMRDALSVFAAKQDLDDVMFAKRFNASFRKLIQYGILQRTKTDGRYEISPVLRLIFGAEQIHALAAEYQRILDAGLAQSDGAAAEDGDDR
ncbi:DUF4194 domain-containing protein [Brevibacterium luteolum]|uniref:DUF4194 domain-containing protein n=1 Tax=Brevibacterium luteolum TaxID=199591 RepID=A0A2N6PGW0_9MICO|nr:DUF4194 domain-containing protein [Brevibacterium luteolum]PMB97917.1 hypothetical protein CJ198_08850 [Brevibacterium luteolum]QIN29893.1 DUF4194 domain-containing protein [Brevibacterium luteolum]